MIGQKNGGDGRNTTKAHKVDSRSITKVIYQGWIYFLMSLNSALRMLVAGLFLNKLEPCGNTSHQSYNKDISSKMPFFMGLATFEALPQILSLCKLGNNQPYEFKGLEDLQI